MSDPSEDTGSSSGNYSNTPNEQDPGYNNNRGTSGRYNGYSSHRGGYTGRAYHRVYNRGDGQGRFGYGNADSTGQDYGSYGGTYPGYQGYHDYRNDYYYGGRSDSNRFYAGGEGTGHNSYGPSHDTHRYNQTYQADHDYNYEGNNRRGGADYDSRRYTGGVGPRYSADNRDFPEQRVHAEVAATQRPYDSGNTTPVEHYHRSFHQPKTETSGLAKSTTTLASPVSSIKKRVDKNESPFFYLTGLDESTDDANELENIRLVLKESDSLDRNIEAQNLQILKNELELGILTTQCERDALSVQLTQEKLDSLLMQG